MSDLQAFREETKDWLETHCPPEMRKPGDVCWGGRNATFSHPDQKIWLERMGNKGWTCPTWPKEYGGGGLSKEENKILQGRNGFHWSKNAIRKLRYLDAWAGIA